MCRIENEYYEWLLNIIHMDQEPYCNYSLFIKELWNKKFRWLLPLDDNRYSDGLRLRSIWAEETFLTNAEMDIKRSCSTLEVLISLAMRCEDEVMQDPDEGDRTYIWFWDMINNLLIEEDLRDDVYDRHIALYIIDKFLDRKYSRSGVGNIFKTRSRRDMRKMDIWYQLVTHLNENYPLDLDFIN